MIQFGTRLNIYLNFKIEQSNQFHQMTKNTSYIYVKKNVKMNGNTYYGIFLILILTDSDIYISTMQSITMIIWRKINGSLKKLLQYVST